MTIFHRVNQRQRDFAFLQVAQHRFSKLLRRRRKIKKIIHELKCEARIPPILRERLLFFAFEAAQHGAESRATAEETCGLIRGQPQRIFFGYVDAANFCQLDQLPFHHFLCQVDEDIKDAEIAFLGAPFETTACTTSRR